MQKRFWSISVIVFAILILSSTSSAIYVTSFNVQSSPQPMLGEQILVLVATGFSYYEFVHTQDKLELLGCNITMTGPSESIQAENYQYYTMDFLITEIDIGDYDCVFIPGGDSPENLVDIPDAITLVQNAFSEGLIIAAICHGPLVLATADIINGYNISGYIEVKNEVEVAGGNWINSGIVIHYPFVTANYMYAETFYTGIIKALGYNDTNPPELLEIYTELEYLGDKIKLVIELKLSDPFGIARVWSTIRRTSGSQDTISWGFIYYEDVDIYNTTITREWDGTYEIDIEVKDHLENEFIYTNATIFTTEIFSTTGETTNFIPWLFSITISLLTIIHQYRKRQ